MPVGGTHGGLLRLAVAKHSVIVDSDVVVGRRSRHRADVLGRRPQGPDSRRCHQRAAPCPLARVLAASSARRSSELFQPYVTQMYILLVQRAGTSLSHRRCFLTHILYGPLAIDLIFELTSAVLLQLYT